MRAHLLPTNAGLALSFAAIVVGLVSAFNSPLPQFYQTYMCRIHLLPITSYQPLPAPT
jgi:hypothetical protein